MTIILLKWRQEFEGNLFQTFCSFKISATLLMKRKKKKSESICHVQEKEEAERCLCLIQSIH